MEERVRRGEDTNSFTRLDGEEQWEGLRWGSLIVLFHQDLQYYHNIGIKYSDMLWLIEKEVRGKNTSNLPTIWMMREEQWPLCTLHVFHGLRFRVEFFFLQKITRFLFNKVKIIKWQLRYLSDSSIPDVSFKSVWSHQIKKYIDKNWVKQ